MLGLKSKGSLVLIANEKGGLSANFGSGTKWPPFCRQRFQMRFVFDSPGEMSLSNLEFYETVSNHQQVQYSLELGSRIWLLLSKLFLSLKVLSIVLIPFRWLHDDVMARKRSPRCKFFVRGFLYKRPVIHWCRVTHTCVREPYHHWLRWRLFAWLVPSHYLNKCWNIFDWTLRNKLQ